MGSKNSLHPISEISQISEILIESFPTIDWDRKKLNHIFNSKEYRISLELALQA